MKRIISIFSMLLIMSILYSMEVTNKGIQFEYQDENAHSVFLVGSMNNWNTDTTPMEKDENGMWKIVLNLGSGKHSYKFIVDGNWHFDQDNPNFEDDGYGGSNSVIEIDTNGKLITNNTQTFGPKVKFIPFDKPPSPKLPIRPIYPEIAQEAGIEGTVWIQFFINVKGVVTEAYVQKGLPNTGLDEAALSAVLKSKWKPAQQQDKKVGVWQTVPVVFSLTKDGIKSTFNPKIYFKGRYFTNNLFMKNETDRFMLDKPEHNLNFGISVKFNSEFEGFTLLNVNNHEEGTDMSKTHFNYKRSYLKLKADYFNVTAFNNFGLLTFDDPLHIVGDIGYNDYNFGYDFSGLVMESSTSLSKKINTIFPVFVSGRLLFSDKITYNEDDISAVRMKLKLPKFFDNDITLGAANYKYTTKATDEIIQIHDNSEVDLKYSKDINQSGWKDAMSVELSAEYSVYENSKEDTVRSVWMDGENFFLGVFLKFPAALNIFADYLNTTFQLSETNFSRDRYSLGANFTLNSFVWNLSGQYWKNYLPDSLNWGDYYKYVEKTDGNGRWYQQYSEVPFEKYTILGYKSGFLWESDLSYSFEVQNHNLEMRLKTKSTQQDVFTKSKFIENILVFKYEISDKWELKIDTRIPYYNDPFLELKTDFKNNKDVFISNYTEILYHLSENVWLTLGYGLNPLIINSVTDEFYDKGREEYLDTVGELPEHLESYYGGFGEKIRDAETMLMNENRISLQAVIKF